jgi:hypothetical protein
LSPENRHEGDDEEEEEEKDNQNKKSKSPFFKKESNDRMNSLQKRPQAFFELPEPTIQYKALDSEFYKALGGKRKRRITTMTLD